MLIRHGFSFFGHGKVLEVIVEKEWAPCVYLDGGDVDVVDDVPVRLLAESYHVTCMFAVFIYVNVCLYERA